MELARPSEQAATAQTATRRLDLSAWKQHHDKWWWRRERETEKREGTGEGGKDLLELLLKLLSAVVITDWESQRDSSHK